MTNCLFVLYFKYNKNIWGANMQTKHQDSVILLTLLVLTVGVFTNRAYTKAAAFDESAKILTKAVADSIPVGFDSITTYQFKEKLYSLQPRTINAVRTDAGVCYTFDDGMVIERRGGTIAWRNNNPGCIRYSEKSIKMGAIGKANNFAIFPDEATGMRAIKTLLSSDSYCNLSIVDAIHKYAPPHENDTDHYIQSLCRAVGVPQHTKLCDLNDEQMDKVVKTIRKIEGWVVGTEKVISSIKTIDGVITATSFANTRRYLNCYMDNAI